jgi:hypothetical protein
MKKSSFVLLLLALFIHSVSAQFSLESYAEVTNNMMSEGPKENIAIKTNYDSNDFFVYGGALFSLNSFQGNLVQALSIEGGKSFTLKNMPLSVAGFYLWSPISIDLREYNAGIIFSSRLGRFAAKLGLNTRIYAFTKAAIAKYGFADTISTSIWEPVNVMYQLSYFQPLGEKLNLELRIANFDTFMIQQETNPMILTQLKYSLTSKLELYGELGYLQAGLLNMRVNYFGIYGRGGVVWKI